MTNASTSMADRFLGTAANICRRLPLGRRSAFSACWNLAGRPARFVTALEDLWFVVDAGDDRSRAAVLNGIQDEAIVAIILDRIREGATIVDIGANKGMLSLFMARKAGASGRVFAYEPDPRNFLDLQRTVQLNGRLKITAIQKAIYSAAGKMQFDLSGWDEDYSGVGRIVASAEHGIEVETATFDAEMQRLGLERVDLLKIDIEGGEVGAVQGMRQAIAGRKFGTVVMELHDFQGRFALAREDAEATLDEFRNAGYEGYFFDQHDFSNVEGRAALRGDRLALEGRVKPLAEYSWEARNRQSGGRWLRPLQFVLTPRFPRNV